MDWGLAGLLAMGLVALIALAVLHLVSERDNRRAGVAMTNLVEAQLAMIRKQNRAALQHLERIRAHEEACNMIKDWAHRNPRIARAVVGLRGDRHSCVVTAADEDQDGTLHDAMCDLELVLVKRFESRIEFMLLRASEAAGESTFVDPKTITVLLG